MWDAVSTSNVFLWPTVFEAVGVVSPPGEVYLPDVQSILPFMGSGVDATRDLALPVEDTDHVPM